MVLYLPSTPVPPGSRMEKILAGENQNPGNHPAVVVGKWEDLDGEECVEIRLCTTLCGTDVREKKKKDYQQEWFMLADNTEDNKPHGTTSLATLIGSARFGRRTYINLSRNSRYPIEYKHLDLWNHKAPMIFDAISLRRIRRDYSY